jgi:trehalose 6-phosphate phosphatase
MAEIGDKPELELQGFYRRLNARAFRDSLADIIEEVEKTADPVIITRHGKDRIAIISIDDLRKLDSLKESAPRRLTSPPPLDPDNALFLDFDGTLLEIAPRPELVRVPDGLIELLTRLAEQRGGALAVLSGRRIDDLDRFLQPWHGAVAGIHGAEFRRPDGTYIDWERSETGQRAREALSYIEQPLKDFAATNEGVFLEHKRRSIALHYRQASEKKHEIENLAKQLLNEQGDILRLVQGKLVVEFSPRHYHKGRAIAAFMADPPFRGRIPVFIGDDTTDEDGFAEVNGRGGLSIRVGPSSDTTVARYNLPSVAAVLDWLVTGLKRHK